MDKRVLVLAQKYMDEDNFHELYMYEDISEPKQLKDLDTDEVSLVFKSKGKQVTDELCDIEWYRIVPSDSHMANYVRKKERYDCTWNDNGEVEKEE
ncbi:hypothetical protein [Enterococcus avium]|uniref:hypothetical protein n=1 Tax=Enterococcus avium TaxID=33945 RepID=UPI001F572E5E|nr:hypothetical protein [Enterococcus avium]